MAKVILDAAAKSVNNQGYRYRVQVGLFRDYYNARNMQMQLYHYLSEIVRQGELYAIHMGDFSDLDEAAQWERALRLRGFDTLLIAL